MTTSLVQSLAWPAVALTVVVLLRSSISSALAGQIKRLKVGPIEADFYEAVVEAREELPTRPEEEPGEKAVAARLLDDLVAIADVSPDAAVVEAFRRFEHVLRQRAEYEGVLPADGRFVPAGRVAQSLYSEDRISAPLLNVIRQLTVLRNTAAHGGPADIDLASALAYIDLVGSAIYQLERGQE